MALSWNDLKKGKVSIGDVVGAHKDPIGTTQDVFTGAGQVFGGIGAGVDRAWKDVIGEGPGGRPSLEQQGIEGKAAQEAEQLKDEEGIAATARQDVARNRQSRLAQQLFARSEGRGGPSAAEAQLQQASEANQRQAMALASSGRGNPALASRFAGQQQAQVGQQAAQQSAALRAQEQQAATTQLGSVLQGARQQELGTEQQRIQREQIAAGERNAALAAQAQADAAKSAAKASKQGGLMGMFGSLGAGMMSDERKKEDKEHVADSDVEEFYSALQPKSYKYKDPHEAGASGGEKVGMMAQDVQETKLGDKLFNQRADGISVYDPQVLDGILLAGVKKIMKEQKHGDD